jgi:hypothetical protein
MGLSLNSKRRVEAYWEKSLGVILSESGPELLYSHSGSQGFVNLVKWGHQLIISGAQEAVAKIESSSISKDSTRLFSLAGLSEIFKDSNFEVLGPAFLGYSDQLLTEPATATPALNLLANSKVVDLFRRDISDSDWESGGIDLDSSTLTGVVFEGSLVAIGAYDVWDNCIAHICVLTHPRHRGRGHAATVTHSLMKQALTNGHIPQFRTLLNNKASVALAQSLDFEQLGSSMAVVLSS